MGLAKSGALRFASATGVRILQRARKPGEAIHRKDRRAIALRQPAHYEDFSSGHEHAQTQGSAQPLPELRSDVLGVDTAGHGGVVRAFNDGAAIGEDGELVGIDRENDQKLIGAHAAKLLQASSQLSKV